MAIEIKHIFYELSSQKVTNEDLCKQFPDQTPERIYKKTGINVRYNTTENIIGSDLAYKAAVKLFKETAIKKEDIEFVLFCTEGLDYIAPMTACLIQQRLGLNKNIGALDLPSGCAGFTHALGMSKAIIESGQANNVLLLFGDTPGLVTNPNNLVLRALFSDAGAAIMVEKSSVNQIGKFIFGVDGTGAKHLFVDKSCLRNPVDKDWLDEHKEIGGMPRGQMYMNGLEVFSFSLKEVPKLIDDILEKNNLNIEDIDLFVLHQASDIILSSLQKKLKIPENKMVNYLSDYGNTVAVSIPLSLAEAQKEGRIKKGDKILIAGYGIGFSWSGTVLFY